MRQLPATFLLSQVCLYAFDCLYKDGETLIQQSLMERRAALYASIEEKEGEFVYASTKVGGSRLPTGRQALSKVLCADAACFSSVAACAARTWRVWDAILRHSHCRRWRSLPWTLSLYCCQLVRRVLGAVFILSLR